MIHLEDINHSAFSNKKSFLDKFLNDIKSIDNLVDKEGKALYSDKNLYSLFSKRSILQAKYNNPERYQEINDLYKLYKQGKAPRYVISTLFPESEFHMLPKSDMLKLLKGENYYPQLKSASDASILKFEAGEAFSIGKDMFVKTSNGFEKLKMDATTYEKLFPPIERYAFAQGHLGNCHLMAALDSITKNPQTRIDLYKMFEQTQNGVKCTLKGLKDSGKAFDFNNLSMLDGQTNLRGSLGHKMIEFTHAKHMYNGLINNPRVMQYTKEFQLRRMNGDILKINDFQGDADDVADHFATLIGRQSETIYPSRTSQNIIEKAQQGQKGVSVVNCLIDMPKKGLVGNHFYNAGNLKENTLVNPWNTMETINYSPLELADTTFII